MVTVPPSSTVKSQKVNFMMSSSSSSTPRIKISIPRSSSSSLHESPSLSDDDDEEQEFGGTEDFLHDHTPLGTETMTPQKAPATTSNLWEGLRNKNLNFPINTECTSLCLSPSGHFVWAGFSDGTLRVFDLSGRFDLGQEIWQSHRQKSTLLVPSTSHQRFGAVACQIHARGVHTDLLMQVNTCGDYVFGGVPRGAIEVYAVHIKDLEDQAASSRFGATPPAKNILDYIHVHVHADAKLKGLGACTQLQNAIRPTYLLLTGKGIKNIHIWKFQPPIKGHETSEAVWEQLYDTQTNGNTINFLSFYRNPEGILWGVSQSDTQKVRLWDLSVEEQERPDVHRPKRPDYEDVTNSQAALGVAGGYGVCGGPTMYNQFSIVSLDNPKSVYNHTELALPGEASWGRQRRGDLKQVVNVATLPNESNHALLELDDGSIVHYTSNKSGRPKLEILTEEKTGIRNLPADYWCRTLCLGYPGLVVAAVSYYNPNTQLGHIEVRSLQPVPMSSPIADSRALSRLCMEAPPASGVKTKKKKKKKRTHDLEGPEALVTPMHRSSTTTTIPMSMDVSVQEIKKKKKKRKSIIASSAFSTPASEEKRHAKGDVETSQETPSEVDNAAFETKKRSSLVPNAPQVSPPGTSTPMVAVNSGGAPLSEQSNNADHGAMVKFLKPKRVLHNYSEQQTPKASPAVTRKIHKDESSVSLKPCDEDKSISSQSKKGDGESLEIKVRTSVKIQSAATGTKRRGDEFPEMESKRPCPAPTVEKSVRNVAHLLVDLKSPIPKTKDQLPDSEIRVGVQELLQRLFLYNESLPQQKSRLLTGSANSFGSFPAQSRLERTLVEHRTAQVRIQKRLLQAAESTLRLLVIKRMTPEGIRSELKDIIRSFEEIVHDTLTRQKLELGTLVVDRNGQPPSLILAYQGAFDVVKDIYNSFEPGKRTPGRPKAI